jgi:hypothetical protein
MFATSVMFKKLHKESPDKLKFGQSGHPGCGHRCPNPRQQNACATTFADLWLISK